MPNLTFFWYNCSVDDFQNILNKILIFNIKIVICFVFNLVYPVYPMLIAFVFIFALLLNLISYFRFYILDICLLSFISLLSL